MYDLLLKGGEVIDPAQGIHGRFDVAIEYGKIGAIGKDIANSEARKVIPVNGKLVTPGLIDIHCHPGKGVRRAALDPDEIGLASGVTLLCDGGTAGPANFHTLLQFGIKPANTGMFCFLNLANTGIAVLPEIWDEHDIDPELTRQVVEENRNVIKGIKLRAIQVLAEGIGIKAVEIAKKLAANVKLPLVLHIGDTRERFTNDTLDNFTRAAVKLMDRGDILCHFMTSEAGGLILADGAVYPELWEAQKRGVILDSCHGMHHLSFTVARHAIRQGLLPAVISTDLGAICMPVVQSLLVTMSKFLSLGLSIDQVLEMTTINPAKALGEEIRRGSLKPGIPANVTVLEIVEGEYLFSDGRDNIQGSRLLEPRLVLKDGAEVPCCSKYHIPPVHTIIHP